MKFSSVIISIFLMCAVVVGLYTFLGDLASGESGYDISYDDQYMNAFNEVQNMTTELNTTFSEIQQMEVNSGSSIQIITLVPEVLGIVIDLVVLPFNLVTGMTADVIEILQLPSWVATFAYGLLAAGIIFALISLILRYRDV